MKEYLEKHGIKNIQDLKKAIENMDKINLSLFKGE